MQLGVLLCVEVRATMVAVSMRLGVWRREKPHLLPTNPAGLLHEVERQGVRPTTVMDALNSVGNLGNWTH